MVTKSDRTAVRNHQIQTVLIETTLHGMKEITAYARRFESIVLKWIMQANFPASKVAGGIWVSDKLLIDEWFRANVLS